MRNIVLYLSSEGIFGVQLALTCCLLRITGRSFSNIATIQGQLALVMARWNFCYLWWQLAIWSSWKPNVTETSPRTRKYRQMRLVGWFSNQQILH